MNYLYQELTEKIIKCFYKVHDKLGYGFLESVYENALLIELKKSNIEAKNQCSIKVYYENNVVVDFRADILIEDKIIIELKAISSLNKINEVQLVNYLKATGIKVGLLVNFGEKLEFKRKIF